MPSHQAFHIVFIEGRTGMPLPRSAIHDYRNRTGKDGALSASAQNPVKHKNGIIDVPSKHSVDETVDRVKNLLQSKGIPLFCLIDHSGEAAKVGLKMPPTKLLIFGSPKAGTPLMLAAPSIAIDLPLKILVW